MAHLSQALYGHGGQLAVGLRTDVHQQVGVLAGGLDEVLHQGGGRFVVLVVDFVAPHAVHRFTGFERQAADVLTGKAGGVLARQVALKNLNILACKRYLVVVIAHKAGGLQAVDKGVLFRQLPIEIGVLILVPPAIKPDGSYGAVVGKKFGQLVVHKLVVAGPVSLGV